MDLRNVIPTCYNHQVKWLYVLVLVPILAIGLTPVIAGSQAPNVISSPSGNIHCKAYGSSMVICTTTHPFRSVRLVAGRAAVRTTPLHLPTGPILTYGDAWGADLTPPVNFQCASEQTGMVCTDFGVHGFTISRARALVW